MMANDTSIRLESFVRLPIVIVTLSSLLLHAVVGCCWHHAHMLPAACCEADHSQSLSTACIADVDHHRDHDLHVYVDGAVAPATAQCAADCPGRDHHHQPCDGQRCVFLRAKPVLSDEPAKAFHSTAVVDTFTAALATHGAKTSPLSRHGLGGPTSPVRAHLLHQVLLI